jgi:hypothetical protein
MAGVRAVDLTISCCHVSQTICLEYVALIPSFLTDVVSLQMFTAKSMHLNRSACQLFYNSSPFCNVISWHRRWALELDLVPSQTKEQPISAFLTRSTGSWHIAEALTDLWQRRLGNLNNESYPQASCCSYECLCGQLSHVNLSGLPS